DGERPGAVALIPAPLSRPAPWRLSGLEPEASAPALARREPGVPESLLGPLDLDPRLDVHAKSSTLTDGVVPAATYDVAVARKCLARIGTSGQCARRRCAARWRVTAAAPSAAISFSAVHGLRRSSSSCAGSSGPPRGKEAE